MTETRTLIFAELARQMGKNALTAEDETLSLIDLGIDSFSFAVLLAWLEEQFHIAIENTDMTPENLDTPERIVKYVESRLGVKRQS